MSILEFKVTREEWLQSIFSHSNSNASMENYQQGIKVWDQFLESIHQTDRDVLSEMKVNFDKPDTYMFLNRYVVWMMKQGKGRASIDLCFAALRSWCSVNGVMLFNEYIKSQVKFPKKHRTLKVPLQHDQIGLLVQNASKRMGTIMLVLMSSGMRIGECLQIKVGDINQNTNPIEIRLRSDTTKTREERKAYISSEAWNLVKDLIRNKSKYDYAFIEEWNPETSVESFECLFGRLRKQVGLLDTYDNGRYHVNVHSFRAYFHTAATKVLGGDTAHALIGHRKYLDVYFRLSQEERSALYKKLEPYISVSKEAIQRGVIEEKDRQIRELNDMKKEIIALKAYQKRQELRRRK